MAKYYQNRNDRGPRRNEAIRTPEVRVINSDGQQLGVMATSEAIRMARAEGVDLIEIAAQANPPVCRIMDFGKYRYEQDKKEREQKQSATKLKEVKFRIRIDQNDYRIKLRKAEAFLLDSNKVKLTLSFRMREMAHPELGLDVIQRAIADLAGVAAPDAPPRKAGRAINTIMSPLPSSKRKPKFTVEPLPEGAVESPEDDEDDDESLD
jgi:translation initiation factor IF-3